MAQFWATYTDPPIKLEVKEYSEAEQEILLDIWRSGKVRERLCHVGAEFHTVRFVILSFISLRNICAKYACPYNTDFLFFTLLLVADTNKYCSFSKLLSGQLCFVYPSSKELVTYETFKIAKYCRDKIEGPG